METVIKQCELWTDNGEAEEEIAKETSLEVDMESMNDYNMAAEPVVES